MKKVTLLVLDSRRSAELRALKRLGVLHPQIEERADQITDELIERRELLRSALVNLSAVESVVPPEPTQRAQAELTPPSDVSESDVRSVQQPAGADHRRDRNVLLARAESIAGDIAERTDRIRWVSETIERLEHERDRVRPWGEFDPSTIAQLNERGVTIRFATMPAGAFRKAKMERAIVLESDGPVVRFALAELNVETGMDDLVAAGEVVEFVPPENRLSVIEAEIEAQRKRLDDERVQLAVQLPQQHLIQEAIEAVEERLHDHGVYLGMNREERIAYIGGFAPEDRLDDLRAAARENGWGLLITDPPAEEPVPTKLKNPRWVELIRPVFEMLGVVPGYREQDISMPFLAFFTVFVGMIIGDAGYGALIFVLSLVMLIVAKAKGNGVSQFNKLGLVLGVSVTVWGAMTGNWFGYAPIAQTQPFSLFVVEALDTSAAQSGRTVQLICFTLAVIHLSLAHIWNFLVYLTRKPAIRAIGDLGWLGVVIGLYFLVLNLFLDIPLPQFALPAIFAGLALVFVFAEQRSDRGFFRTILYSFTEGLLPTIFSGISAFSDVISYIRLYAIGIASVEIAQAFNEMASGGGIVAGIIILTLGHTLNLIMGGLAVIVHGVRLNVLEFAGHLGMEWTGFAYQPFAESGQRG